MKISRESVMMYATSVYLNPNLGTSLSAFLHLQTTTLDCVHRRDRRASAKLGTLAREEARCRLSMNMIRTAGHLWEPSETTWSFHSSNLGRLMRTCHDHAKHLVRHTDPDRISLTCDRWRRRLLTSRDRNLTWTKCQREVLITRGKN